MRFISFLATWCRYSNSFIIIHSCHEFYTAVDNQIMYIKHISGQLQVSWLTRTQEYAIECYSPQDINKCFLESLTMQMM